MARIDQGIYLYKSNVIWLAPVPIYLHPNVTYRLSLRIEQDPLKLWPFRDEMCSQDVLDFIRVQHGWVQEQLPPFLVQMRGLWYKTLQTDHTRSLYKTYFGMASNPESPAYGAGTFLDKFYGTRAFRTGLRITIGDDDPIIIDMHDPLAAIVTHTGSNTPYHANVPNYPKVYPFAYSKKWGLGELGNYSQWSNWWDKGTFRAEYSGDGYVLTVETDGYCITTLDVEAEGREIRVGFHVEQSPITMPQGLGTARGSTVELWASPSGGGPEVLHYTRYNNLPWSEVGNPGAGNDLGATYANELMHQKSIAVPRETIYNAGGTYSVDSSRDDWTAIGAATDGQFAMGAGGGHYAGTLTSGESYATTTDTFDMSVTESFRGRTQSLALAGAPVLPYRDSEWKQIEPFAVASALSINDNDPEFAAAVDNWSKWDAEAKARWAQFNNVVTPPRIKISGTFEVVNVMDGSAPFALYADLPYQYDKASAKLTYTDIMEPESVAVDYDEGTDEIVVHDYKSADWFARAQIGEAILNGEIKLGHDGCSWQWLDSIDEFDGDSTIPEDKLAEGPNSYIYDDRSPKTYAAWLADDAF